MPKRQRSLSSSSIGERGGGNIRPRGISDLFPLQEIFLRILSFLDAGDLASAQGVSKYWSEMTVDQQLWKRLYLSRYPHPHHSRLVYTPPSSSSSSSTPSTPRSLRPIARLPSRAFPPPSPRADGARTPVHPRVDGVGHATPLATRTVETEVGYGVRNDGVDWKMMLRLGTNWSNGNALSQATISLPPSPSPSASGSISTSNAPAQPSISYSNKSAYSEQHIALSPSFIFTSSPESPLVQVHPASSPSPSSSSLQLGIIPPPPGWSSPSRPDNVTAICADQSVSLPDQQGHIPARLAIFYQSGGFAILSISRVAGGGGITWLREAIHPAQSRPKSIRRRATTFTAIDGDPVVLATLHYPIVLTCTLGFHLSVYTLGQQSSAGEPSRPKHLQTMHSDVSFHPAALTLLPHTDSDYHSECLSGNIPSDVGDARFKAALTYCTPLYPSSWTVAVQEFNLDFCPSGVEPVQRGECWHVGGDELSDELIWPRKVKPLAGVKGAAVGIGMDGRWCVLAGDDNQIQVYSLPTPSPSPSPREDQSHMTAPIVHSQTLLAHSAAVTSISLSAGRCVSGGRDGRVLVWELDEDDDDTTLGKVGRTVGYVEVRSGGRKLWRGAAGPNPHSHSSFTSTEKEDVEEEDTYNLPHPQAISSAARSLFLPRPPMSIPIEENDGARAIRRLAFDEEKIVGLVSAGDSRKDGHSHHGQVMKVWNFS